MLLKYLTFSKNLMNTVYNNNFKFISNKSTYPINGKYKSTLYLPITSFKLSIKDGVALKREHALQQVTILI